VNINLIRCLVPRVRIKWSRNMLLLWDRVVWNGFFIFTIICDWLNVCCCLVVRSLVVSKMNRNTFWITGRFTLPTGCFPFQQSTVQRPALLPWNVWNHLQTTWTDICLECLLLSVEVEVAFNITLGISSLVMCEGAWICFWWNFAWRILREYQNYLLPLFASSFNWMSTS
jgi:hypothetical protein